jgi:hypothetical protein
MCRVKNCHLRDRISASDVYIGRPSKWGNPFVIGKDGTREEVVEKYKKWVLSQPRLVADIKSELNGKNLVCFCSPRACHGDILLAIAAGQLTAGDKLNY